MNPDEVTCDRCGGTFPEEHACTTKNDAGEAEGAWCLWCEDDSSEDAIGIRINRTTRRQR